STNGRRTEGYTVRYCKRKKRWHLPMQRFLNTPAESAQLRLNLLTDLCHIGTTMHLWFEDAHHFAHVLHCSSTRLCNCISHQFGQFVIAQGFWHIFADNVHFELFNSSQIVAASGLILGQ